MWRLEALPFIRGAMARDRFIIFLKFISFDNENTRAESVKSDKAEEFLDIWTVLNQNIEKNYMPYECITKVDFV